MPARAQYVGRTTLLYHPSTDLVTASHRALDYLQASRAEMASPHPRRRRGLLRVRSLLRPTAAGAVLHSQHRLLVPNPHIQAVQADHIGQKHPGDHIVIAAAQPRAVCDDGFGESDLGGPAQRARDGHL